MDPTFQQWLTERKLPQKLLNTLKKEDITNQMILRAMNDSDLEGLKKKYKLPMGHVVTLRAVRDELQKSDKRGSFEIIQATPPVANPVERDAGQRNASPRLPTHPDPNRYEETPGRRPRGNEIRDKYQLPPRDDKYSKRNHPRNGASAIPSATPSPLALPEQAVHTPTHGHTTPGSNNGLQTTAHMEELYNRGVERGEKLNALEQKSRGIASGAMDYERMCAQLAEKQQHGKKSKKKKKSKKDDSSTLPHTVHPQQLTYYDNNMDHTNTSSTQVPPHTKSPSHQKTSHTFPSPLRHSSQSPSHTYTPSLPGSHSDPIHRRSPHVVPSYGTMSEDRSRPTTPTSLTYTSDDEKLHLHYDPEMNASKQTVNNRGKKCCCCCRTM